MAERPLNLSLWIECEWDDWADKLIGGPNHNADRVREMAHGEGSWCNQEGMTMRSGSVRRCVFEWLAAHGPAGTAAVAAAVGLGTHSVQQCLSKFRQEGKVKCEMSYYGRGRGRANLWWVAPVDMGGE